jgi:hypothetical protein
MIEIEHSLFGERSDELDGKERVSACLFVYQLRQRRGAIQIAAQRVGEQLPYIFAGERRQSDPSVLARK